MSLSVWPETPLAFKFSVFFACSCKKKQTLCPSPSITKNNSQKQFLSTVFYNPVLPYPLTLQTFWTVFGSWSRTETFFLSNNNGLAWSLANPSTTFFAGSLFSVLSRRIFLWLVCYVVIWTRSVRLLTGFWNWNRIEESEIDCVHFCLLVWTDEFLFFFFFFFVGLFALFQLWFFVFLLWLYLPF